MSRTWPQDDRDEYEVACSEAWDAGESTRERGDHFLRLVLDADQAGRVWAADLLRQFHEQGAQRELKSWGKANEPVVALAYDGRILSTTRLIGVRRRAEDGSSVSAQTLFDLLTWEEIETKIGEYLRQVSAYRDLIAIGTRLLELRDLAPGASTPAEAADKLGTTVDAWLMHEESA